MWLRLVGGACDITSSAQHLEAVEPIIHSFLLQKFGVRALFYHLPSTYHGNAVGVVDGRETMSNDNARSTLPRPVQGLLHYLLTLRVQSRGGLVQEEELWVSDQGTGNGNPLLLSARQLRSFAPHVGVVSLERERVCMWERESVCVCMCVCVCVCERERERERSASSKFLSVGILWGCCLQVDEAHVECTG